MIEAPSIPDHDDPSVPGDESLLRRLSDDGPSMIATDAVTGERRPTSGAFKPDPDGLSVYRLSKLVEFDMGAADVARTPWNLIVSVSVEQVRSIELGVRDDPWPRDIDEEAHPRNVAHALIVGWANLTKGERKRRQKALVLLPSMRIIYP